jgi:FlaA1/EpsC-like NDP-sugar epimerase
MSYPYTAAEHPPRWVLLEAIGGLHTLRQRLARLTGPMIVALHGLLVIESNYLAYWLRFDGDIPPAEMALFIETVGWLAAIRMIVFIPFRLYGGLWQYTGLSELGGIVMAVAVSSGALVVAGSAAGLPNSRSIVVIDAVLLVGLLSTVRLAKRVVHHLRRPKPITRVLIIGAGDAGEMIVRDMNNVPHGYEPVGLIDDDPTKVGQRIHGVPVLGSGTDLVRIVGTVRPDEFLIAMPSAGRDVVRAFMELLQPFRLPIRILPSLRDVLDGRVAVSQIRELTIEDLLSRDPVRLDSASIQQMIVDRTVLVTGAGGSIGSELSRQIAALAPATVVLYERYENSLHDLSIDLVARYGAAVIRPVIGDVTDAERVRQVFDMYRPDLVFHAAAHKHVPLMEYNPCEAVKNNVIGTATVAAAAQEWGTSRFILISTDKAVNPSSVMGATKRVAERVIESQAGKGVTRFSTVRFGNVLGSNGSVLPLFLDQIRRGGPVTVTHPEIRRYFMLIPEAVQLVLHVAALDEAGLTYVLDMGEQIKLADLARDVIRLAGFEPDTEIPITFIGLRPGEKLFEELVGIGEWVEPSPVPKILRVHGGAFCDPDHLELEVAHLIALARAGDVTGVIYQLHLMLPRFEAALELQSASRRHIQQAVITDAAMPRVALS